MPTTSIAEQERESVGNIQREAKIIPLNPIPEFPGSFHPHEQLQYSGHTATAKKLESAESFEDENYSYLSIPKTLREEKIVSDLALRVIRTQYSKDLIEDLRWLAENHEISDSSSMPYLSDLFILMKKYFDDFFHDPFSSFLGALYDGLIHDDTYLTLTKTKYQSILNFIEALNNQDLDYKKIDKYISKLDDIGLNVTPY